MNTIFCLKPGTWQHFLADSPYYDNEWNQIKCTPIWNFPLQIWHLCWSISIYFLRSILHSFLPDSKLLTLMARNYFTQPSLPLSSRIMSLAHGTCWQSLRKQEMGLTEVFTSLLNFDGILLDSGFQLLSRTTALIRLTIMS